MKHFFSFINARLLVLAAGLILASCNAENLYSTYTARFTFSPVTACPPLNYACTSPGQFCLVSNPAGAGGNLVVKNPDVSETGYIAKTALSNYTGSLMLGVSGGLIIGLPSIAEMGQAESVVVCYDAMCPTCDYGQMKLSSGGIATCYSCSRTYNLNNGGIVSSVEAGKSLYRYYCTYMPSTYTIRVQNN